MSDKTSHNCVYCGNQIHQPRFSASTRVKKCCSDRCKFLSKGIDLNTQLGVFLSINEKLVTEFTETVNEYISLPYRNMHGYIHSGVSPIKKYKGLSGDVIATNILFGCHDISSQLIFKGGRLDYRMFLIPGSNQESKITLPGSTCEAKKGIALCGMSSKKFMKELDYLSSIHVRNKKEDIHQTKYSLTAHKLCVRLGKLYDENKDRIHVPYGEPKSTSVLKAIFNRKITLDSSSAFYLARHLDCYGVHVDYRLLLEPIKPSMIGQIKNGLSYA